MGKTLIVAEKPSVGRDIARVVGATTKATSYLEGDQYIVTWAIGHLVTLSNPEEIDEKYKTWSFDTLPIMPDEIKNKVVYRTRMQYGTVRRLLLSDEVEDIICATDSGREGELIFRRIYHMTGCTKPFRRLWISSMTDEAIRDGMANLRPGGDYDNLYESARCRAEADWLVGMNGSRGFSLTYNSLLSVGRVQSPTLAILVKRELERKSFIPVPYLELWATFRNYKGRWFNPELEDGSKIPVDRREEFEALAVQLKGSPAEVLSVDREQKVNKPPLLYDLTQLQRDANRILGWSASKTLRIAQTLYEKRKVITYPRTDSNYLSNDLYKTLKSRLTRLKDLTWDPYVDMALESERKLYGRVINDARVSDHHAIIPTGHTSDYKKLKDEEAALFDLIARRFISIFLDDQIVENLRIVTRSLGHLFESTGVTVIQEGWSSLQPSATGKRKAADDLKGLTSDITVGDERKVSSAKLVDKKTQPPSPYTEAMLLAAMEHASRLVEDEELADEMKDRGLGTPATRAAIIERLIQVRYVNRRGKILTPTEKGIVLISILPDSLRSAEITGRWEQQLNRMSRGETDPNTFMTDIRNMVVNLVDSSRVKDESINFPEEARRQNPSGEEQTPLGDCPNCENGQILENSKAFYCSNWRKTRCNFTVWKNAFSRTNVGPEITPPAMSNLLKDKSTEIEGVTVSLLGEPPWVTIPGLQPAAAEEPAAKKPKRAKKTAAKK